MPHSSGGGSHSGGSGGGGFHSSGGGSHGGGPSGTVSRKPFAGGTKYVYYNRHGDRQYVYKSGTISPPDKIATGIAMLFYTILAVILIGACISCGVFKPTPIESGKYIPSVYCEDHIGILNETEIRDACEKFKNALGVTPSVELIYDSEWEENYSSLETFAYSEYLRIFDDEMHWLVVISLPDNYENQKFVDWKWQGIIGDECGDAVNSESEEEFTKTMQKYLLRSNPDTLSACISTALQENSEALLETRLDIRFIIGGIVVFLFYLGFIAFYIADYRNSVIANACMSVPEDAREFACEYCGRIYVEGTVQLCQGCGAPIPIHMKVEKPDLQYGE